MGWGDEGCCFLEILMAAINGVGWDGGTDSDV